MKIYVAARFYEKERVKVIYEKLTALGHEITVDWTTCTTQKPYDVNFADAQECARHTIDGVKDAEIFIFLSNEKIGAGSSAELGAALLSYQLRGFPLIYAVGPHRENNLCLYHPAIEYVATIDQVFTALNTFSPQQVYYPKGASYPRIGIGVIVLNAQNKILLGKRKNSHGDGDWAPPGGHLEFGESPIDCAKRELLEETGLQLLHAKELTFTNDIFSKDHKHYLTVFVQGTVEGEPKILEPDKCSAWKWFDWGDLPSPLFLAFNTFVNKNQLESTL